MTTPITHPNPYLQAGISAELRTLAALPDENIDKPHSRFFASLIRLASLGKAAGVPPGQFVPHIWQAVKSSGDGRPARQPFRNIERQWRNAWKMAVPRAQTGSSYAAPPASALPQPHPVGPRPYGSR